MEQQNSIKLLHSNFYNNNMEYNFTEFLTDFKKGVGFLFLPNTSILFI